MDQAVGYATIAAQGVRAEPYLVASVVTRAGHKVYSAEKKTKRVFAADVMADTTYAMQQVLGCSPRGTACGKGLDRPAAGKTGTTEANENAWFIGFTPQLSTAVWIGMADPHKTITGVGANASENVYGGGPPAQIWQSMMNAALAGVPVESFPRPAYVGKTLHPQPTATATATPSSSTTPTPTTTSGTPSPAPSTPSATPTSGATTPPVTLSPTATVAPTAGSSGGPGGGGSHAGGTPSPAGG